MRVVEPYEVDAQAKVNHDSVEIHGTFATSAARQLFTRRKIVGRVLLVKVWGSVFIGKSQLNIQLVAKEDFFDSIALVSDWVGDRRVIWTKVDEVSASVISDDSL